MTGMISSFRARLTASLSSVSAFLATVGSSWNLCHSICTVVIVFLAGLGVVVTGMPLLFLFEYSVYLWGLAVLFLFFSIGMFLKMPKCISKKLLMFNFGVILTGVPSNLIDLQPWSWIVGGLIALVPAGLFFYSKLIKRGFLIK